MYKPTYVVIANTSEQKRAQVLKIRARDRHEAVAKAQMRGAYLIKSVTRS